MALIKCKTNYGGYFIILAHIHLVFSTNLTCTNSSSSKYIFSFISDKYQKKWLKDFNLT